TERLHARSDQPSTPRNVLVAGVALGLLQLASTALPGGYHSIAWVAAAFLLFAVGFALRTRPYRWAAFGVLALAAMRLLAVELRRLSPDQRIVTFVIAGVLLLIVSFLYTRARARAPG
ncbi:MAG: DUF2339 domain-containing protein, partial [Deltaproteobacteria bacterium]|nr:DUF2339 domain-containing protein [Deltaproteobacteria bacterium]